MAPEVCEDSWESSQRSQGSRALPFHGSRISKVPVPLDRVKVERDVYISEPESGVMEFHVMGPTCPGRKRPPVFE